MTWLRQTLSGPNGELSSKRHALLIAVVTMGAAEVILAVAACFGYDVGVAISGVSASLAGVGGWSYTKKPESKSE